MWGEGGCMRPLSLVDGVVRLWIAILGGWMGVYKEGGYNIICKGGSIVSGHKDVCIYIIVQS